MAQPISKKGTYKEKAPKTEKCLAKLAKAKERRLSRYGNLPIKELSTTSRHLFLKWGHRADEVKRFLTSKIQRKAPEPVQPIQ